MLDATQKPLGFYEYGHSGFNTSNRMMSVVHSSPSGFRQAWRYQASYDSPAIACSAPLVPVLQELQVGLVKRRYIRAPMGDMKASSSKQSFKTVGGEELNMASGILPPILDQRLEAAHQQILQRNLDDATCEVQGPNATEKGKWVLEMFDNMCANQEVRMLRKRKGLGREISADSLNGGILASEALKGYWE